MLFNSTISCCFLVLAFHIWFGFDYITVIPPPDDDDDDDDDWKKRKYWWSRYQSRRSGSVADIAAASATYTTHTHKYCTTHTQDIHKTKTNAHILNLTYTRHTHKTNTQTLHLTYTRHKHTRKQTHKYCVCYGVHGFLVFFAASIRWLSTR